MPKATTSKPVPVATMMTKRNAVTSKKSAGGTVSAVGSMVTPSRKVTMTRETKKVKAVSIPETPVRETPDTTENGGGNTKKEAVPQGDVIPTSVIAEKIEKKSGFFSRKPKEDKSAVSDASQEKSGKKSEEKSTQTPKEKAQEKDAEIDKAQAPSEMVAPSAPVGPTPKKIKETPKPGYFDTFGLGKERDHFIENLSMLVLSGMSITSALASITKETRTPRMKKILEDMLVDIESGSTVWRAFDKTGLFKGYTISLIRLGEESGKFADNLRVVALEEEKEREFKSKVKSALMYPVFVLVLTAIVGTGISWFILPKLAKIFTDLHLKLPLITKILIGFGLFLSKYGLLVVPLTVVVIGIIYYIVFMNPKSKFLGEYIVFSVPGVKGLLLEVEVARFGYLLGTLLEAGLPVTRAIDSLASASEVIRYKRFYIHLRDSVDMGNSFQKSFASYKKIDVLIPQPMQQLTVSGEQSGNLNKTLIKIGQMYEMKSDTTTKNLTIIMEPILLVIVWAGVVCVAFAVILPIYSLVGGIHP